MSGPFTAIVGNAAPGGAVLAVTDQTAIGFYLVYAVIAVALVVWLARTLYRNGAVFLVDVFDDPNLARAVNQLLVIGFYLLNLGYALLLYEVRADQTLTEAFNELAGRIGLLLLSLGVIHLTNMFVFWRIRTHRERTSSPLPPATQHLAPPPPPVTATP